MAVSTTPITDAADELASSLTEGAEAVDELAQGIVSALNELDRRITAVEEGGGSTVPPTEPTEPPEGETGTIPITFDDPIFGDSDMDAQNSQVVLERGQTLTNTSIEEQSGEPSIVSLGNNRVGYCRVRSRECVRITGGELIVESCYLEAKGQGDDHADTLQAYSPGETDALVILRNTHVRAFNQSATAGYFTADTWSGTIVCENVIFQGGPFGIRAISDGGCHIDVEMENVFFVGPFGYHRFSFEEFEGGEMRITKWRNVRDATIVNGKLVPGNIINQPSADELAAVAAKAPPRPVRKNK